MLKHFRLNCSLAETVHAFFIVLWCEIEPQVTLLLRKLANIDHAWSLYLSLEHVLTTEAEMWQLV